MRGWIADGRSMDPGANVQSLATGEVRSGEEYQTKFQICMYVLYMYHGAVLIKIEKKSKISMINMIFICHLEFGEWKRRP